MTEIAPMPCGGRIAIESPGYDPCDDCQGVRLLCGVEQCTRAPEFGAAFRGAEFEAWLRDRGASEKYAKDTMKGARRCIEAGVNSTDMVTDETLPGLSQSTLSIYRAHLKRYETFLADQAPRDDDTPAIATEEESMPVETPAPDAPTEEAQGERVTDEDPCTDCEADHSCGCCEHGVATTMTTTQAAALREAGEAMRLSDELDREEVLEVAGLSGIENRLDELSADDAAKAKRPVRTGIIATTDFADLRRRLEGGAVKMASDAVRTRQPEPAATVLLPIPVDWIDSVLFDRDGCRVWIGGGDPEELGVSHETGDAIVALLRRAAPCR